MPPGEAPLNHHQPLRKVFEYLKAFTELRFPPVKDIEQQKKVLRLDKLPLHPSVELFSNGLNAPDESEASGIVLRVTRPSMSVCPPPPASIANWIKPGWNDVDKDAECYSSMNVAERDGYVHLDQFDDVQERVATLTQWRKLRREWQRNERPARDAAVLFQAIYEWFGIRERESEEIEILVGEGLLNCSNDSGDFNHQVLLQRVDLEFYPEKSNPQFVFRKRDQPPELYLELLRAVPGANLRQLSVCIDELKKAEISPLGRQDTEGFLKRLVQGVFAPTGQWITTTAANQSSNSQPDNLAPEPAPLLQPKSVTIRLHDGQYELSDDTAFEVTGPITADNLGTCMEQLRQRGWEPRLSTIGGTAMRRAPVIFMRKRQSGMSNVFDLILEDIANRLSFPEALIQIIGGNSPIPSDNGNGVSQQSRFFLFKICLPS